jgi:ubiquinone/menaquinone biosynthesis C-methylase UbiE
MDKLVKFDGNMPSNYDQYLVPIIFEDYAQDLANRVAAHQPKAVLETAAGTGVVTRHLNQLLDEESKLTATDLNPEMLDIAKSKLGSVERIVFEPADALDLPYADDSFDVVVCQFGIMFFPDKLAGMKEVMRVLRPGGVFVFNVWDALERNHHFNTAMSRLNEIFSNNPIKFMDIPFHYHQIDGVRSELQAAGFGKIEVAVLPGESVAQSVEDLTQAALYSSPMAVEIEERTTDATPDIKAEVAKALADAHGDNPTRAPLQAIAFEAHLA